MKHRPRVSPWDITAIGLLGAVGFALSYDALQQMAQAIHIRGQLTYAFPIVVDGFIAYGVRALVLLREAPRTARAYTWSLFAGATGTSVWANALHAIRLNDTASSQANLHLGDVAVGSLSTIAPLALAGAVHLGIIVTRHGGQRAAPRPPETVPSPEAVDAFARVPLADDGRGEHSAQVPTPALVQSAARTAAAELDPAPDRPPVRRSAEEKISAHHRATRRRDRVIARLTRRPVRPTGQDGPDRPGGPDKPALGAPGPDGPNRPGGPDGPDRPGGPDKPALDAPGPDGPNRPGGPDKPALDAPGPDGPNRPGGPDGPGGPDRPGGPDPELLEIGRSAAASAGRISRTVVATAIRKAGHTASNERVGQVLHALRTDRPPPHLR
ncbi:DUF2637 domain-containing protein [Kitasatospora purpeofusca]|uniref:DUF2637 domain-containing protein n=1 Tax=Kitasatospora purpeofusca TaxID=67352 RepID=UPI0035D5AAA0